MKKMPLHRFCEKPEKAVRSGAIPSDKDDRRLLSGYLNPYRAMVIAQDHLLTGILLKAVDATLKIIYPAQRGASNAFLISHLRATGLNAQSDIVNFDNAQLHSMTFFEAYSLAVVAFPALLASALAPVATAPDQEAKNVRRRQLVNPRVTKSIAALGCVASAADTIATFWTLSNYIVERYGARLTSVPDVHQ